MSLKLAGRLLSVKLPKKLSISAESVLLWVPLPPIRYTENVGGKPARSRASRSGARNMKATIGTLMRRGMMVVR